MGAKEATVEDGSPSPPPLPNEPPPEVSAEEVIDQPIASLGEDHDEEDDNASDSSFESGDSEWDPSEQRLPGESSKRKVKETVDTDGEGSGDQAADTNESQPWQAVWSPEQNAWYFWNTKSGEVTWTNPLDPSASASSSTATAAPAAPVQPPLPAGPPPTSDKSSEPTFGLPPDIDPELAHLLPASQRGAAQAPTSSAQTALFNARTGRFTPADYNYTVDHLDEYNRSKRMNSHYFDVEAWEKSRAEENAKRKSDEQMGVSSKKQVTKKDMERFKKKAAEKKFRSQAWLRD